MLLLVLCLLLPGPDIDKISGDRLAAEMRKLSSTIQQPDVVSYVTAAAGDLAAELPEKLGELKVEVIAGSDHKEPVVYRPGYLFVPLAVLVAAKAEADFLRVLAHAVGHFAVKPPEWRGGSIPMRVVELHRPLVPMALRQQQEQAEAEADREAEVLMRRAALRSPEAFERAKAAAVEAMPKRKPPTLRRR